MINTAITGADPFGQPNTPGSLYYRHPDYVARWWWREFNRVSYIGGREYYQPRRLSIEFWYPMSNTPTRTETGQLIIPQAVKQAYNSLLFRHNREQEWEFQNRHRRAHYFNPVRTTVNALVSHATKKGVTRDKDKSPELEEFWAGVDCERKSDIDAFMRDGLRWAQVGGIRWACVDVEAQAGADTDSDGDGKPYAYWVDPADIMDWSTDEEGIVWLKQFIGSEAARDWDGEIKPVHTFRVWKRDEMLEFRCDGVTGARLDEAPKVTANPLGRVPFEPLFSPARITESDFPDGEPLITDFAKAANSVYNYTSLLNDLAYKQAFSLLCVPDPNVNAIEIGTNTVLGWNSTAGAAPVYISPDAAQMTVLMALIVSTLGEMRQTFGTGRGRQEGSMQKSSAAALELESEDKRSILGDIASAAEDFEKRLATLVLAYKSGATKVTPDDVPHIQYSHDFDLQAFQDEINEFLSLRMVGLSPEVDLKLRTDLLGRKLAGMPPDDLQKLLASMQNVPAPIVQLPPPTGAAGLDRQALAPGAPLDGPPKSGQVVGKSGANQAPKPGQGNASP